MKQLGKRVGVDILTQKFYVKIDMGIIMMTFVNEITDTDNNNKFNNAFTSVLRITVPVMYEMAE